MYVCIIKTHHLLSAYSRRLNERNSIQYLIDSNGRQRFGRCFSRSPQSVENTTVLNGLWMFYAFYKTPLLRTASWCAIYLFYINGKSTYLAVSRCDESVMLMCYIDLFGQQVCDNLFFYQHKKDHLPFWICFLMCAIRFFIWMENFSFLSYFFDMLFIEPYHSLRII